MSRDFGKTALELLAALSDGSPLPLAVSTGEFAKPQAPDSYHHILDYSGPNRKARRKADKARKRKRK